MNQDEDIFDAVKMILQKSFGLNGSSLRYDSRLKDLGLDSLDYAEFIVLVEAHFFVIIPDDKIDEFKKIVDVVDFLEEITNR